MSLFPMIYCRKGRSMKISELKASLFMFSFFRNTVSLKWNTRRVALVARLANCKRA